MDRKFKFLSAEAAYGLLCPHYGATNLLLQQISLWF